MSLFTRHEIPNSKTTLMICYDGTRIWKCGSTILTIKDVMDHSLDIVDCELCWILLSTCTKNPAEDKYEMVVSCETAVPLFVERNILWTKLDPDVFVSCYNVMNDWEDTGLARTYFDVYRFYPTWPALLVSNNNVKDKKENGKKKKIGIAEHINVDERGVPFVGLVENGRAFFRGFEIVSMDRIFFPRKLLNKSVRLINDAEPTIQCLRYGHVR